MSFRSMRSRLDRLVRRPSAVAGIDWDAVARGDFSSVPAPDDMGDPVEELIAAMRKGDRDTLAELENRLGLSPSQETPDDKMNRVTGTDMGEQD